VITCDEPQDSLFEKYSLSKESYDNYYLLAAIRFQENHQGDVVIISADRGALVKAKRLGLTFHKLGEEYFRGDEPSEEEKKIKPLEKEVHRLTSRQSKPEILFENKTNILRVSKPLIQDIEVIIRTKIEEERLKYPYKTESDIERDLCGMIHGTGLRIWMQSGYEQIRQYNSDVDDYLKEYEEYIRLKIDYEITSTYLQAINLLISNVTGSLPTGQMHIFIEFSETAVLYSDSALRIKNLNPPIVPRLYSNRKLEKQLQSHKDFTTDFARGGVIDNRQENYYWDLTRRAKHTYEFSEQALSHKLHRKLTNFRDLYLDLRCGRGFQIKYAIVDESLIDPIRGALNIIIEDSE
jgi:hypothetical protein